MEDIMETCYLDCISMCPHQYRCRECKREKQHQEQMREIRERTSLLSIFRSPAPIA